MVNIHIIGLGSKIKGKRAWLLNQKPQISQHNMFPFVQTEVFAGFWALYYFIHLKTVSFLVLVCLMIFISC